MHSPGKQEEDTRGAVGNGAPAPPALTPPKGGGAIRGIGEKFSANPVTGTASVTIPIATSPGRSGFAPQLALSYDSGAGNGPFGWGWSLSLPSIARKTDKGVPRYGEDGSSDVFILSGGEDLVPVATPAGVPDPAGVAIQRYRPRIEGLFARIERWTETATGEVHWRTISRDNVTTIYGRDGESRVVDPADPDPLRPQRIFAWLICESYDDKGNVVVYRYKAEDSAGVDTRQSHERNRTPLTRGVNRYLARVLYGNTVSRLAPNFANTAWLFEVVLDYEQGRLVAQPPDALGRERARAFTAAQSDWTVRADPFSTYRAGFEVRTYRLCRRALMFHHFAAELGTNDYLVRTTEFTYDQSPLGSFLTSAIQSGYVAAWGAGAAATGVYLRQSLPPLEFDYSKATIQARVDEVDTESSENLPPQFDGRLTQWVDLDGEGLSGVLSEQAGAWYYKPNEGEGRFGALQPVALAPSLRDLGQGRQQLLDLTGDGALNLADFGGATPGFYERTPDRDWDTFRPFDSLPRVDWNDPNLRFVDLTGDGVADVLITHDDAVHWHHSLGEDGFAAARRVPAQLDEERGPRLVFADGTECIYLADLSGDGLADLVRIRNGEVCYWPSAGHGRFGAKVTMDGAPWFEHPDLFEHGRIRLADIDGSGTTDILYLGRERVSVYRNACGNAWSAPEHLTAFPGVDDLTTVTAIDLLGNGTACLAWSSPLPNDARRTLRYVDLMGGQKPHLLVASRNNLGAETRVRYVPSTRFYLADRRAGRPWVTRLPFPVHVVERTETLDLVSRNRFVTRYAYHHGHYDGVEREFRGFGMVEQWDTEEFAVLSRTDAMPSAANIDQGSHVPPMLTKTWFHTGAFIEGEAISRQYEREYWVEPTLTPASARSMLLPDTLLPVDRRLPGGQRAAYALTTDEVREACRALKGATLRQETYAVDGTAQQGRPYSVAERNYTIELLQPRASNAHAVIFTHPREAISFQYERTTYTVGGVERYDPRVSHTFTLAVDDFGNPVRSASVAYGRRLSDADLRSLFDADGLANVAKPADRAAQRRTVVSFVESGFTNATDLPGMYRAPLPCESRAYQLFGAVPAAALAGVTNLFTIAELRQRIAQASDGAHETGFGDFTGSTAVGGVPWRRLMQKSRMLYRRDTLGGAADGLLPLGVAEPLALPGESYRLAYAAGMVDALFVRDGQALIPDPVALLGAEGGYVRSQEQKASQLFPGSDADDEWWIPAGRVFYTETGGPATELTTARSGFFLPRRFRTPFRGDTYVRYDSRNLMLLETEDALGNRVTAGERDQQGAITQRGNDYRVLAPFLVSEPNRNRTEVAFDALGMVTATCVMGKPEEARGDRMAGLVRDPGPQAIAAFFGNPRAQAAAMVQEAGTRLVYDIGRFYRTYRANPADPTRWEPPVAASLARETHASDPPPAGGVKVQVVISYSDGLGREVQHKIQAEAGPVADGGPAVNPRWVGSGWTVFNNKGKAVRAYEPFFDDTHRFRFGRRVGVSPVMLYDPAERCIATLHPNHSWDKIVFDPWRQAAWDVNDTSAISDPSQDADLGGYFARLDPADYLPSWTDLRTDAARALSRWPGTDAVAVRRRQKEAEAARLTLVHAATPTVTCADALGRAIVTVAHNRTRATPADDVRFPSRNWLDLEGHPREIRDAIHNPTDSQDLGRLVVAYDYDMAGGRVRQRSFEAGTRWSLADASGNQLRQWDARGHAIETGYDVLRRPAAVFVSGGADIPAGQRVLAERTEYGEGQGDALNHRGRVYRLFDGAGRVTHERYDFKGYLERSRRQLLVNYSGQVNWQANPVLATEAFTTVSRVDALGRPVQVVPPYSRAGGIAVVQNTFNDANMLERVDVWRDDNAEPATLLDPATALDTPVTGVEYDAKGQRRRITYGNGVTCSYAYDPDTFRLTRLVARRRAVAFPADCPTPPAGDDLPRRECGVQNLQYVYDPAGNVTHIHDDAQQTVYYNGTVAEASSDYKYDALYRLIEASGREHVSNTIVDPPANRPTWKSEYDFNDWTRRGLPLPGDGQAMVPYVEQYGYDAVGNFLELAHQLRGGAGTRWVRRYDYRSPSLLENGRTNNRLTTSSLPGDGPAAPYGAPYGYDAHGNVTGTAHLAAMEWDFRDRLHATQRQVVTTAVLAAGGVTTGPAPRTWYVYDGTGQRIRKVTEASPGNVASERIYVGNFEIYREYGAGGALGVERETLHVMDDSRRIAMIETTTLDNGAPPPAPDVLRRYQLTTHVGSCALELNEAADVISYEEYYPYGATAYQAGRRATEVRLKRYRFTGKERDEESGFYYHGARYYAPWLGRWMSCDPSGVNDGLNLYRYARDNPIVNVDMTGMQTTGARVDPNVRKTPAPSPYPLPKVTAGMRDVAADLKQFRDDPLSREGLEALGRVLTAYVPWRAKSESGGAMGLGERVERGNKASETQLTYRTGFGYFTSRAALGDAVSAEAVQGERVQNALALFGAYLKGRQAVQALRDFQLAARAPKGGVPGDVAPPATEPPPPAAPNEPVPAAEPVAPAAPKQTPAPAVEAPPAAAAEAPPTTPAAAPAPAPAAAPQPPPESIVIESSGGGPAVSPNQSTVALPNPGEGQMPYGSRTHQDLPRIVNETNPGAGGQYNVAPGLNGADLANPTGMNATYAEMKSLWGRQSPMLSQGRNWGHDPQTGRYFFYDRDTGFVFEGVFQTEKFPGGRFR